MSASARGEELSRDDEMYQLVCKDRFEAIENGRREDRKMLIEIHAKVTNGFDTKITNTNNKTDEMKDDMDRRFDETTKSINEIRTATRATLIAMVVAGVGLIGAVVAAIVTGFFGLIDQLAALL